MTRVRHSSGRRRRKHDDHANHEAWAIPYADLLTLLLAFFVVMYAISSVNAGKYRVLSDSLFAAFRGAPRTFQPVQVGDRQVGQGADLNTTTTQQSVLEGKEQSRLAPLPVASGSPQTGGNSQANNGKLPAQAAAAAAALSRLADDVEHAMEQLVRKDLVRIRRSDFWIEVEMNTDILFPSGSARLADNAADIIERLGQALAPFPNPIRVEGHTDNKPIKTAVFSSNWELSAARAGSVVRVLSTHGVAPNRLAVIGYGEQRPMKANDTPEGRNANRRVVVVILSTDLMQQSDPSKPPVEGQGTVTDGSAAPPEPAGPINAPRVVPGSNPDGAVATPAESPQAIPSPPAPAPAAAATTVQTAPSPGHPPGAAQSNTGTEPAP